MNSREPRTKIGLLDCELNYLSKILFFCMCCMALVIVFINGINTRWFVLFFRYLLLLSSIIPISLRVNLDFAKLSFSYFINKDKVKKYK